MDSKTLKSMPFPLPPFHEQRRIVRRVESLFTKLDEAKEKAQAVVDSFEIRKAAILHKAFTGELTAKWREEHGVRMESWEKKSVGELCISLKYGTANITAIVKTIPSQNTQRRTLIQCSIFSSAYDEFDLSSNLRGVEIDRINGSNLILWIFLSFERVPCFEHSGTLGTLRYNMFGRVFSKAQ